VNTEHIRELFAQFGPVEVRRMFGGAGLFVDGVMFGIAFNGVIYLKTSEATLAQFQREGSAPFVYPLIKKARPPRRQPSSYWRLPERLYDDPEELAGWAIAALAAAQRKKSGAAAKAAQSRAPRKAAAGKTVVRKAARRKTKAKRN